MDNTIKIWNAIIPDIIDTLSGHTASVISAVWSHDGLMIVSGSMDGTIKIWNVETRQLIKNI